MRRLERLVAVAAVVGAGIILAGSLTSTDAQIGMPVIVPVTVERLESAAVDAVPAAPALFELARVTYWPQGGVSINTNDTGLAYFYLESGALTVVFDQPLTVTRGALLATPTANPQEEIAAGTEFVLQPGDSLLFPLSSQGEINNEGSAEAVALASALYSDPAAASAATAPTTYDS